MNILRTKLLAACLCTTFLLCGCFGGNKNGAEDNSSGRVKIVATIFPLYDFACRVAGDRADIKMLVSPGAEVHSYEPTAKDIIEITQSDLFLNIGGSADPWTEKALSANGEYKGEKVSAADYTGLKQEETVEGMEEEEDEILDETEYDEHVWTTPRNAEKIVKAINDTLCRIDPENKTYYEENMKNYSEELEKLHKVFIGITENAQRRTIVFADRFPLRYFADEYNLKYYAAFPGCSSESEPSAGTVSFLVDKVREENIPAVFYTETSDGKIADTICEATGAEKLLFHSCHNVTKKQFDKGITYLEIMQKNADALKKAID